MSRVKDLPKKIPSREINFTFECEGDVTGEDYSDNFQVLVPDVRMMGEIGLNFARLNGGIAPESLDASTRTLHNAVAWLNVCIMNPPKWLIDIGFGLDTLDTNVALLLFTAGSAEVRKWKENLRKQPTDVGPNKGTISGEVPNQSPTKAG